MKNPSVQLLAGMEFSGLDAVWGPLTIVSELFLLTLSTSSQPKIVRWSSSMLIVVMALRNETFERGSMRALVSQVCATIIKGFVLRFSLVCCMLAHECAHLFAAAVVGIKSIDNVFSVENVLGNIKLSAWMLALIPFVSWPNDAREPYVVISGFCSARQHFWVRTAAPVMSVMLALGGTLLMCIRTKSSLGCTMTLGAWLVAGGAIASDVLTKIELRSILRCGNFGMLVICALDRLGVQVPDILREMAATTAARGGQAGGLVTLLPDGTGHRCRYVPFKRADVADGLTNRFFAGLWFRRVAACLVAKTQPPCRMFLGHTRFATSSRPSTNESHPHRFSLPRKVRVWRAGASGWFSSVENFEVFVTHNGDFDYWPLFGRVRTQGEIGQWLKQVLGVTHDVARCDSVKVAGVMELLRTQGVWEHSLRLAYQIVAAPPFEETVNGKGGNVISVIRAAGTIADRIFGDFIKSSDLNDPEQVRDLSNALAQALYAARDRLTLPIFTMPALTENLALKAVSNFLESDLFTSMVRFLGDAQGSFGLSACSSLDRNLVCIASRGQAMCISFCAEAGAVLWGSEAATQAILAFFNFRLTIVKNVIQMVPITTTKPLEGDTEDLEEGRGSTPNALRCNYRHDLDENEGEIIEVSILPNDPAARNRTKASARASAQLLTDLAGEERVSQSFQPFPDLAPVLFLRVHKKSEGGMVVRESFMRNESLINLESDMIVAPPPRPGLNSDRVEADLKDIPRVLEMIHADWKDENGRNRRTAAEFFRLIQEQLTQRAQDPGGRLDVDVLVTGVEASLWIGEQFASDLQTLFPALRVVPVSANKIVGVLSNHRGTAPMAGFAFSSLTLSLKKAIVVSISHSGQTFPTLHATHALRKVCGDRLFVLTGAIDSKMSAAVGQTCHSGAPWIGRVWYTFSGWRPSEALTVSTVSCHHTLSELLLFLAKKAMRTTDSNFRSLTGFKFTKADVDDIAKLNKSLVATASPSLVGYNSAGQPLPDSQAHGIRAQGRRWALHALETPWAWCLSTAYIFGTIVAGYPLFSALRKLYWIDGPGIDNSGQVALTYVALVLDCLLYSFLPLFFSILLRILQCRPLTARLGKRTILIGDVPYVHQLVESYVSKLFAESYSIATVDVHGANAVDHLVHRFTHRVVRGLLIAVGRPDGRLFALTKAESWVLMALQQCKSIVHLLSPPEIVTVGHNPYVNSNVVDHHVVLARSRPKFFCEVITNVTDTEPLSRNANIRTIAEQPGQIELEEFSITHTPLCSHHANGLVRTRDQSIHLASQLQTLYDRAAGADPDALLVYPRDNSGRGRSFMDISGRGRNNVDAAVGLIRRAADCSAHGPHVLDRALEHASGGLMEILNQGSAVELWCENRYASLERYIAFLVMFHAMAARVAAFFPLNFDIARSQSQLRVATTAAPISAAELEKEWASDGGNHLFNPPHEIPPDPTVRG